MVLMVFTGQHAFALCCIYKRKRAGERSDGRRCCTKLKHVNRRYQGGFFVVQTLYGLAMGCVTDGSVKPHRVVSKLLSGQSISSPESCPESCFSTPFCNVQSTAASTGFHPTGLDFNTAYPVMLWFPPDGCSLCFVDACVCLLFLSHKGWSLAGHGCLGLPHCLDDCHLTVGCPCSHVW